MDDDTTDDDTGDNEDRVTPDPDDDTTTPDPDDDVAEGEIVDEDDEPEKPAEQPEPTSGAALIQDNVSEPGVEHTGVVTRAGQVQHTSSHSTLPTVEDEEPAELVED